MKLNQKVLAPCQIPLCQLAVPRGSLRSICGVAGLRDKILMSLCGLLVKGNFSGAKLPEGTVNLRREISLTALRNFVGDYSEGKKTCQ